MTNISSLINYISSFVTLLEEDKQLISKYFTYGYYPKGSILAADDAIARKLFFIQQGYVRCFSVEHEEEVTTQIFGKNNLVAAFESFVTGTIANTNVKCISDCEVLYITRSDYDSISANSRNWALFCKKTYEATIAHNLQRTKDLISLTAEKRYLKLVAHQPDIIQNVPINYIASYIGIKPESLSRIRKKLIF